MRLLIHCFCCHPQVWSFCNSCQAQLFPKLRQKMLLTFTLELQCSPKHEKLHGGEVRRVPFYGTLHQALRCSYFLLTQLRVKVWGVQIAVSWSFRITRPNGHSGIVTCSAKISRCASTALISPAASLKLIGLADFESKRAVWGRMTCDAPLSAIAIGFTSLTGTNILAAVRNTLLPHAAGVTLK